MYCNGRISVCVTLTCAIGDGYAFKFLRDYDEYEGEKALRSPS